VSENAGTTGRSIATQTLRFNDRKASFGTGSEARKQLNDAERGDRYCSFFSLTLSADSSEDASKIQKTASDLF
jgi:hypothetical protein